MFRPVVHILLHFLVPAVAAGIFWRGNFLKAWLTMTATMVVDVDHVLADPVYAPGRCSIGFHPLHKYPPIAVYGALALWPKLRLVGVGLLIHMALDAGDCVWMHYEV